MIKIRFFLKNDQNIFVSIFRVDISDSKIAQNELKCPKMTSNCQNITFLTKISKLAKTPFLR